MQVKYIENSDIIEIGHTIPADQEITEHRLSNADNKLPGSPIMIMGDFNESISQSYYRRTHLWPQAVYTVQGAALVAAFGVVSQSGQWLAFPRANIHGAYVRRIRDTVAQNQMEMRETRVSGSLVLAAGPGYRIYGHWLSDFLPKFYLLKAAGYNLSSLKYALPSDTPSYGRRLLQMLGINDDSIISFVPDEEILAADEILIPTTMHNGVRCAPLFREAAGFLIETFGLQDTPALTGRRLFLSRALSSQNRSLANRAETEAQFVKRGFEIVSPETLPLTDQWKLLRSASILAGEYGSALHGSMFCDPGLLVIALRGNGIHPEFIQSGFGEALGHPTGYMIGRNRTDGSGFDLSQELVDAGLSSILAGR